MVAAAVEIAGGPTAVARLCGVRRQSIYLWIKEWKVERLVDALKLSRASGIPIEKFAGGVIDAETTQESKMTMSPRCWSIAAARVQKQRVTSEAGRTAKLGGFRTGERRAVAPGRAASVDDQDRRTRTWHNRAERGATGRELGSLGSECTPRSRDCRCSRASIE
jgi:hypothetical protein